MNLKNAPIIDFTRTLKDAVGPAKARLREFSSFNSEVTSLLRNGQSEKVAVIVDRAYPLVKGLGKEPILVSDHLNLTGFNPLVGPNDPVGERFPVVNGIYLLDFANDSLAEMKQGVAAGVKHGLSPGQEDSKAVEDIGADFYCYNMVPTMIVAAHAGWKLVGIGVPDGAELDKRVISALTGES